MLDAPISVDVMRSSRSVQASASCARLWPRRSAISFSALIFARESSVNRSRDRMTSTLIGASSIAQLDDSLGALQNLEFDDDELAEIDRYATEAPINLWSRSSAN